MDMSQSSANKDLLPDSGQIKQPDRKKVLAPLPLARAYDYAVPDGMPVETGDYVKIPLGRREVIGVVWDGAPDGNLSPKRLKYILEKYDCPPMSPVQRRFIDWVAQYTMADAGSVLKMALSVPEAVFPQKMTQGYVVSKASHKKPTPQREKVLAAAADGIPRRAADLARLAGCSDGVIKSMAKDGQLDVVDMPPEIPGCVACEAQTPVSLSADQQAAADAMVSLVAEQDFAPVLLDGVTGAGKTEVYFEAVAEALKHNKQVLILLPEIALSAQFLERFEKRFGVAPAVWHSEVSATKKRTTWLGVASGETTVVVGARSALFLPFVDLGLVIVDEEHDASYKQEEGVLYNARDMAVVRARLGKCPCVLVSATPALETMMNAQTGKYHYLHLPARHAGATLPDIHVVDLKQDKPDRGRFISPTLRQALALTLEAGEQSMLFLNRRGYAPLTLCRTCGYRFQCPSCTAWLVEHRRHGRLQCHHCGYQAFMPKTCPSCQTEDSFAACGPGVERIQEEVQFLFPDARTLVLASDITTSHEAIRQAIGQISQREVDIIIGTQIVAKGHHFPSLTCVGIVDADLGLAGGDLRAGEKTFQLLQQVAGRAGRGEKAGHVYLQTFMPEQKVIQALAQNDRDAFLAAEAEERERIGMPPYGRLAGIIVQSRDENLLDKACRELARVAPRYDGVRVLGPAPAPMAILRGSHRRRFLVVTERDVQIQKVVRDWLSQLKLPSAVTVKADIDPQSFF